MNHFIKGILSFFLLLSLLACGVSQKHYQVVESQLAAKKYDAAEKTIIKAKKSEYGSNNKLLYLLNLGWTFHLAGKHKEAQEVFDEADRTIGDLFTKKTSDDIAAFVGNDNNLPFEGEDFEKIALTITRTLDFMFNGEAESARVEVKKVEERMKFLNSERTEKATYGEDAFAHYLSGLIYEIDEEYNDAYISYFKAYQAYKKYESKYKTSTPAFVKESVMRYADEYANDADLKVLKKELATVNPVKLKDYQKQGQFVFVHYNGYAPKKVERTFKIQRGSQKDLTQDIYMAYPEYVKRTKRIAYAQISINGQTYKTDIVQPIEKIAFIDLKEKLKRIWTKMVVRRVAKFIASELAKGNQNKQTPEQRQNNQFLGNVLHAASNLSEQADLRSWRFLPAEIGMTTISLAPGKYNVDITFHASNGAIIDKTTLTEVEVKAKEKTFKWYQTVR
ncbi:hypothetical protein JXR93_00175 [bacterium]|nr:hypothetical protein [bacterium]